MRTLNYQTANMTRSIAASLIILASFTTISKGENSAFEAIERESTLTVENWMNSNNYWVGNTNVEEQELAVENWMNSTNYWVGNTNVEEQELAVENWMTDNNYWNGRTNLEEQELTLNIESWMNNGAYWTGSEEQTISGNELANN